MGWWWRVVIEKVLDPAQAEQATSPPSEMAEQPAAAPQAVMEVAESVPATPHISCSYFRLAFFRLLQCRAARDPNFVQAVALPADTIGAANAIELGICAHAVVWISVGGTAMSLCDSSSAKVPAPAAAQQRQ
jgi:hypothetical protein